LSTIKSYSSPDLEIVIANEVKQSQGIGTPACRNALPTVGRHFGVQARGPAKRGAPRNDSFSRLFTII